MKIPICLLFLSLTPRLFADVDFNAMGDDTWLRVPTLGQYPSSGVDIHANCDTAGNMYMIGGCTYGNVAGGTHNSDVYRFDLKTGNTFQVYNDAANPVQISCQVAQAYDKTRDCIWFSWGDLWTATCGLYRFQCPDGPITKSSDSAMGMGWRGVCYMYHDAANDLLIAPNMYGIALRDLASGDTVQVAYPAPVDAGIPNVNELPSCFDTRRGLFAMTQWGGCWCAGGTEPVDPPILHDIWFYNTTSKEWHVRTPAVTPGSNFSGEMTYDSKNDKYVYFGSGRLGYGQPELWIYDYDSNQWTQVEKNGRTFLRSDLAASTWPAQRYKMAWTFCEKYNVLVSWGGYNYIAAEAGVVFDTNDIDFFSGAHQPLWYYRIARDSSSAEEAMPAAGKAPLLATPNPFSHTLSIRVPAVSDIAIFDLTGRKVAAFNSVQSVLAWDAGNLTAGVYILKAKTGNIHFTRKLLKVK